MCVFWFKLVYISFGLGFLIGCSSFVFVSPSFIPKAKVSSPLFFSPPLYSSLPLSLSPLFSPPLLPPLLASFFCFPFLSFSLLFLFPGISSVFHSTPLLFSLLTLPFLSFSLLLFSIFLSPLSSLHHLSSLPPPKHPPLFPFLSFLDFYCSYAMRCILKDPLVMTMSGTSSQPLKNTNQVMPSHIAGYSVLDGEKSPLGAEHWR